MSKIYEIADGFVDTVAELNPIVATYLGVPGHDHRIFRRRRRNVRMRLSGMY